MKVNFKDVIFLIGSGYSLGKDIDLLKEIYDKYNSKVIVCDTCYTYLTLNDIKPYIMCNLDHRDEVIKSMTNIYKIEINDTILLGNIGANKTLWNNWNKDKRLNAADYPYMLNVLTPMVSYSIIKYPKKYKICLGIDLCWENNDKFYMESNNKEQGKKNIDTMKEIITVNDIYDNEVFTSKSFLKVNNWIENISLMNKNMIINGSNGPSILGKRKEHILKIDLNQLYNNREK